MNQRFDEIPFNRSLNDSTQFSNSFGNGGGEDGERFSMPPLSPRSSLPLSSLYCHSPFNVGDGGRRVGMPPLSPRSSFPDSSLNYQNPLNNYGGNGGLPPPSPRSSFSPNSPYSQIPTTRQPSFSPSHVTSFDQLLPLSQPSHVSSLDSLPSHVVSSFNSLPSNVSSFTSLRSLSQPSNVSSFNSLPPLSPSPSLSQPSHVSSSDSFPPLSPSPSFFPDSPLAPVENIEYSGFPEYSSLPPIPHMNKKYSPQVSESSQPPRKTHRRTRSEIPIEWNQIVSQSPPDLIYPKPLEPMVGDVKSQSKVPAIEDEAMISSFTDRDTNDSNGNTSNNKKRRPQKSTAGVKRRAGKEIAALLSRHNRSVSVDSCLNPKLIISDESPKLPPENGSAKLSISGTKQIAGDDRLLEIAESNPKYVRRVLTNRNTAQRTQARRAMYRIDLEDRVVNVENENTRLSSQLANAQKDNIKLRSQIKELTIRLEASEKQVQTAEKHAQASVKQAQASVKQAQALEKQAQALEKQAQASEKQAQTLEKQAQAMEKQTKLSDALVEHMAAELQQLKLARGEGSQSEKSNASH